MGTEVLLLWFIWVLVLGPSIVLWGFATIARRRVLLTTRRAIEGTPAVVIGIGLVLLGSAITYFFWWGGRFFPH